MQLCMSIRVLKRSSDLRTSNFKFKFVFVFQPFDIRIQASLIRHRWFCLESGALLLQPCTISLFSTGHQFKRCPPLFSYSSPSLPSLHTAAAFNYTCTAPLARVVYWCKLSKWQILVAQTPASGMPAVTFISPHSADIKRKLLKLLHKYINEVLI